MRTGLEKHCLSLEKTSSRDKVAVGGYMEHIERQVIENITNTAVRSAVQGMLYRFSNAPHLKKFLLKSFIHFPHYNQILKEASTSARNVGKFHYKLEDAELIDFIAEQVKETQRHTAREAIESFRMFSARLTFSRDFKNLLNSDSYMEIENYVLKTQVKG